MIFSYLITSLPMLGLIAFGIVFGLILWNTNSRARQLKKTCTQKVSARVAGVDIKGVGKSRKYNYTYQFEYMGMTITANNGIYSGIIAFSRPMEGDITEVFIDPSDPASSVFDTVAKSSYFLGTYYAPIFAAVLILMPVIFAIANPD